MKVSRTSEGRTMNSTFQTRNLGNLALVPDQYEDEGLGFLEVMETVGREIRVANEKAEKMASEILTEKQVKRQKEREATRIFIMEKQTEVSVKGIKLSRREISKRTGLSLAFVSRVFAGKREPSLSSAALLAFAFGVSIDDIYRHLTCERNISPVKGLGKA